jgi:hypothetical protein
MNQDKFLCPNLIDPNVKLSILNVLSPPKVDYWKPVKNVCKNMYNEYIKKYSGVLLLLLLLIIFLVYRYRMVNEDNNLNGNSTQMLTYDINNKSNANVDNNNRFNDMDDILVTDFWDNYQKDQTDLKDQKMHTPLHGPVQLSMDNTLSPTTITYAYSNPYQRMLQMNKTIYPNQTNIYPGISSVAHAVLPYSRNEVTSLSLNTPSYPVFPYSDGYFMQN